jgi:hypothetical protein
MTAAILPQNFLKGRSQHRCPRRLADALIADGPSQGGGGDVHDAASSGKTTAKFGRIFDLTSSPYIPSSPPPPEVYEGLPPVDRAPAPKQRSSAEGPSGWQTLDDVLSQQAMQSRGSDGGLGLGDLREEGFRGDDRLKIQMRRNVMVRCLAFVP